MVENAANFTSTFENRPSIFEIVAQKSLNDTLYPALQKIALVLSTNVPHKFSWLNDYFEESFLCLNGLLQYYYLAYYDASFSENFYGLKRVSRSHSNLSKKQREYSLIFLVILPYFKRKVEEKIALIRIEKAEGCLRNDLEGKFKKVLLYSHSSFEIIWGLISIHNYVQYMANNSEFQTPLLKLIDLKLTYNMDQMDDTNLWSSLFKGSLSLSQLSFGLIRNAVATSLEVGAFFLQFLQAWNTQKSNYNVTDLPNAIAPMIDNKAKSYQGKCPLCLKSWIIPTVLQVSGYIFCFRCILRFLNENQRCPVTNLPARPLDIVRLYIN
ncbi:peroxisomal biogenesis factor 12 isoform X2 [Leptinotarsa decemlineata]|uniref:peroxisomal biogenesis factor 12 isoform X2 n=1 Tax=Leptinotarsa decemlineata TaxID=7539 RepID=UPI000C252D47|nr:peroxisome assembly protein 12 [Leptinotarsa decemlineata]